MRFISCNSLHKLSRTSDGYHCCELPAAQREGECPMRKESSGMVAFGKCLGVFGGYGEPQGPTQPGSFIKHSLLSGGWTNEFHVYHLKTGSAKQSQSSLSYLPGWASSVLSVAAFMKLECKLPRVVIHVVSGLFHLSKFCILLLT